MHLRHVAVTVGLATTVAGTGLMTAPQASAGGTASIGAASFGTKCLTLHHSGLVQTATQGNPGLADSNLLQMSSQIPYNHCGGADVNPDLLLADETSEYIPLNPMK